jgi:hypothetical protein
MTSPRFLGAALLTTAVLLGTAACSAVGPTSTRSTTPFDSSPQEETSGTATGTATASAAVKAATCEALDSSVNDISESLSATAKKFAQDPSSAVSALESASSTVQGAVAEVQDPQAKTLVRAVSDDLASLTTAVQNAAEHPITGAPAVQRSLAAVQKDVEAITTYCA